MLNVNKVAFRIIVCDSEDGEDAVVPPIGNSFEEDDTNPVN